MQKSPLDFTALTDSQIAALCERPLSLAKVFLARNRRLGVTRPIFCTSRCERVYMTACGCETILGGGNGIQAPGAGGLYSSAECGRTVLY